MLLFKHGALTTFEQGHARHLIDKYPHVVLVRSILDHEWTKENLIEHEWWYGGDDDDGAAYMRKTHLYGQLMTAHGILYFFKDKRDHTKVCSVQENLIDASPFQTFIK